MQKLLLENPIQNVLRWPGMTLLCLLAVILSVNLHEFIHLIVGRFVGLPAHYVDWTAVGVSPEVAAHAPASELALMNGIAPLMTMLLGVLAFIAVPSVKRHSPGAISSLVAWWAIFGVPYIGEQLLVTGLPVHLRGVGADFAAVIGGYWQVSDRGRAVLALIGLGFYMGSGFLLRSRVAHLSPVPLESNSLSRLLAHVAIWRRLAACMLGVLMVGLIAWGFALLGQGKSLGVSVLYVSGTIVWSGMIGLVVPWTTPWAQYVLRSWILPGAVSGTVLFIFGELTHSDYAGIWIVLLPPLLIAAAGRIGTSVQ